jgi:serine/threonine-protein kinase/endoribonuclease IRE1
VDSTGEKVVMKWADFGFSKPVNDRGSHSISGSNRGTDNWYAPEILKIKNGIEKNGKDERAHQRGTVKSDVYTEGLVFGYYLLDGHHPFGSAVNVLPNIVNNKPVNLTSMFRYLLIQI